MPTRRDYEWFRERVAKKRKEKQWSQRAAAQRAKIAPKTWANVESGEMQSTPGVKVPHTPDEETVDKVARALGIIGEVNQRFGWTLPEDAPIPVVDQIQEVRTLAQEVIRRLDQIEDQIQS
jgi:transcriptional regulator with XRE-family HTH domain